MVRLTLKSEPSSREVEQEAPKGPSREEAKSRLRDTGDYA